MDLSQDYIKMCAGAEEVQTKPFYQHQWTMPINLKKGIYLSREGDYWFANQQIQAFLPRQDQLQEMVKDLGWVTFDQECKKFALSYQKLIKIDDYEYMAPFNCSKEKAGLMLVMKQLYNKEWDGGRWINSTKH